MEHSIDLTPLDTPEKKAEFHKYQLRMVDDAVNNLMDVGYHYWYAGCGTGKTLAALELIRRMHKEADASFILVLTVKATMNSVWKASTFMC